MTCNEDCDFEWAIKLPDGTITTVASGRLKKVIDGCYRDPYVPKDTSLGFYLEYAGGRLGKLPECVREQFEDLKKIEVLVEGQWIPMEIRTMD